VSGYENFGNNGDLEDDKCVGCGCWVPMLMSAGDVMTDGGCRMQMGGCFLSVVRGFERMRSWCRIFNGF